MLSGKLKNNDKTKVVNLILGIAVCIIMFGIFFDLFTVGQKNIHTDVAGPFRLYNSVKNSEGFSLYPATWNSANGEIYVFHSATLKMLFYNILPNKVIATVCGSALTWIICIFSIIWFYKKILNNNAWLIAVPLFWFAQQGEKDIALYQAGYTIQIVTFSLCFGLCYQIFIMNEKKRSIGVLHSILLFLMIICGVRYFAEYLLPILLFIFIYFIRDFKEDRNCIVQYIKNIVIYIAIPTTLGLGYYIYASHISNLNHSGITTFGRIPLSQIKANILVTLKNFVELFGYKKVGYFEEFFFIVSILVCFVCPLLQLVEIKKANDGEKAFCLFTLIHTCVLLGAIILGTKIQRHYLLSTVYVLVLFSSNYIYKKIVNNSVIFTGIVCSVVLLTCCLSTYSLICGTTGWKETVEHQREVCSILEDKGIKKIYSTNWIGYPYELYSDGKLQAAAIYAAPRNLQKRYWLVDSKAFDKIDGKTCLILSRKENDTCSDAVNILLGQYEESFVINDIGVYNYVKDEYINTDFYVYVFDHDICNELNDGLWDMECSIWEMDFNWIGTMTQEEIYLDNGGIIHGPYDTLKGGQYKVSIEGENLIGAECYVSSEISPEIIHYRVDNESDQEIQLDLTLDGDVEDIQFYLVNNMKDKRIGFKKVKLEKLKTNKRLLL